ncbi:MAG: E-cinnamoyl-CoA:R-phenyllactate CoA transferase [Smithella sp. PtaU1.Bin162]|nr:MAG: E-cinnamoyl-CoA:R-phenyllactate CoA transferase [Smithella sp. PtaU1.Bin162]
MGPLSGIRVIELAGMGPAPFCGMMLADMGAEVICINRARSGRPDEQIMFERGKKSLVVNLKRPEGVQLVLKFCKKADALIEGFRPGVMERLGLGPEVCLAVNPKLVYGRITGWGQGGPLNQKAGHDINYISVAGVLQAIGRKAQPPMPPLNLIADFGGGGMLLAFGIACALLEVQKSGKGQVVDAAMIDGSALLMAMFLSRYSDPRFSGERGTNIFDTGAHFYNVYETKDGKYISVGAIEPQFYKALIDKLGLDPVEFGNYMDRNAWPECKEKFASLFKLKTRDEWCNLMGDADACFTPVLSIPEAYEHPQNRERSTYIKLDGIIQAAPAPRYSRTEAVISHGMHSPGQDTDDVLTDYGFTKDEIKAFLEAGILSVDK